ncbi:hypothetical protein, partial [Sphingomonas sp. S2M10]|uniref:hypothetical protein n=1 Tax=Sphingomonas sp. S2M10 TaxID=2705010 RepID=UPI00145652AD
PEAGQSDVAPSFAPPGFVEPTLDPALAARRDAAAAAARDALAAADSPDAVMAAYGAMAPSQQAVVQPELGARLGAAAATSNGKLGEATPTVAVESRGGDGPLPMPAPVAVPLDAPDLALAPAPEPTVLVPDGPAQPSLGVDPSYGREIERRFTESTTPERVEESLDAVSTANPGIATSVTDRAQVPRDGANDPQRLDETLAAQREQASSLRRQAAQAVTDGPGPEQVVPRALHASAPAPAFPGPETEALQPAPEAQQLQALALPDTVVASFDSASGAQMQASAEASRQEMARAQETRDAAHQAAVDQAETDRRTAEQEADGSQRQAVADERQAIQDKRQETVDAQNREMAAVNAEAARARRDKRDEAQREVEAGQRRIDARYDQAERDAEAEVRRGEADAERERLRKKKESQEAGWWERAVSFLRDAFDALVSLVNRIFDAVRSAIMGLIDLARRAVVGLIEAVSRALQALVSALGEVLKGLVDGLIGEIFPALARALNAAIDGAVRRVNSAIDAVAQQLVRTVNAVAAALTTAVNALLDAFQGAMNAALAMLHAALTGDWSALLVRVLDAVLSVLGIDPAAFHALIGQASEAVATIVNDPGRFVSNMIDMVVGGVRLFADHFGEHLRRGIIGWLTGALGDIQIPSEWNLWTVLDLARQILGLTWDFVRERAARIIGPENVQRLEMMASWIGTLITEGWAGLWARIQGSLESLRDSVLASIREFVLQRVILASITWLASLFNPVGALVKLVMTIWNVYQFVSGQMQRLFGIAQAVVGAIANIAAGVLEPGKQAIEGVLGNLVPVVIDLLMSLLGVTGVAARVREIIQNLRQRLADAVDAMLQRILQSLGLRRGAGTGEAQPASPGGAGAPAQIGHPVVIDVAEGQDHTLSIDRTGAAGATVMLRSDPRPLGQWLDTLAGEAARLDGSARSGAEAHIDTARSLLQRLDPLADQAAAASPGSQAASTAQPRELGQVEDQLGQALRQVFNTIRGTAEPAASGAIFEQGFSMNGESHTLRLFASNGSLALEMASASFHQIKRAVETAQQEAQTTGKTQLARALGRLLRRDIDRYETFFNANYDAIVLRAHHNHAWAQQQARQGFNEVLQAAVDIGAAHGIKNLTDLGHPSRFVLNDEIRPEFRGYPLWRNTFYKSSWSSTIDPSWKDTEFNRLNHEALTDPYWATNPYVTNPATRPKVFVVRDAGGMYPVVPYLDLNMPGNVHIDHKVEVATHFQDTGNALPQGPRETWYEMQSNLQLLNRAENSRKSGPSVTNWRVTSAFRGPGEP